MVLVSTPASIKGEEVSVLAIVETLTAIGLSLLAYLHYQTFLHIAIGASLAPFLLLRTKKSTAQAIALVEKTSPWLKANANKLIPEIRSDKEIVG